MRLADVMSAAGQHLFAEIALVLAAVAFAVVLLTVFLRANAAPFERARLIPLEDEPRSRAPGTGEEPR